MKDCRTTSFSPETLTRSANSKYLSPKSFTDKNFSQTWRWKRPSSPCRTYGWIHAFTGSHFFLLKGIVVGLGMTCAPPICCPSWAGHVANRRSKRLISLSVSYGSISILSYQDTKSHKDKGWSSSYCELKTINQINKNANFSQMFYEQDSMPTDKSKYGTIGECVYLSSLLLISPIFHHRREGLTDRERTN